MPEWVLIIFMFGVGYGDGSAIDHVNFETKVACEAVAEKINGKTLADYKIAARCYQRIR